MRRYRYTALLGAACALALVGAACRDKKSTDETVAVSRSTVTASATADGASPLPSASLSPAPGATPSDTPAPAPVSPAPASPTAASLPSPAPTSSATSLPTPALPPPPPPTIPGGPLGTPVASGAGNEGAKAEAVRSYFSKTFGVPGFKPPWYDALSTIGVQGDTVTAISTLDADGAGRESAVRMCDALAGYVFAPDSTALGINRIVVRAKDSSQLVSRTGLTGACAG